MTRALSRETPPSARSSAQSPAQALVAPQALAKPSHSTPEELPSHGRVSPVRGSDNLFLRGGHSGPRRYHSPSLAPRQITPGALAHTYDLPRVTYHKNYVPWLVTASAALILWMAYHSSLVIPVAHLDSTVVAILWLSVAFAAFQQLISWKDQPRGVAEGQQEALDALRVVVAVPVYNEDPGLLDRAIWSLANSSRPPDVVHVVEDGKQKIDYTPLREYWPFVERPGFRVVWTRKPLNRGKKWAQSEVFASHGDADIFITIDSDTALEFHAIHEGLKPFSDPSIASVAGIEVMYNSHVNWLTRSVTSRNIVYQFLTWGSQSAVGDLLVNRGTYALYRAHVIHEIMPAYVGETFLGHPIKLGDDAALALFARDRGRTVQQLTAFSLPMCAESLSHHFRQFTRWMRGKAIRDEWRLRYLPVFSYGWLFTVLTIFGVLASTGTTVLMLVFLPATGRLLEYTLITMTLGSLIAGTRVFCVHRSDEDRWDRIVSWLIYPSALLWVMFALRPLRFYGAATCLRQGWVTRQAGAEVGIHPDETGPNEAMALEG